MLAAASEDHTVSLVSFGDSLGELVSLRVVRDRFPPPAALGGGGVPSLIMAATMLTESMRRCAEANEAVSINKAAGNSGAVNKLVKVTRRERPAAGKGEGKGDGPAAPAVSADELMAAMD